MAKRGVLLVALFGAGLLVLACAGGDAGPAARAGAQASPAALDLTKDDLGRKVSPPAAAARIVALSPTIVELMYAAGATPVGRPASATYPEAARSVPSFGESRAPNLEELARLRPDLIIADALLHAGMMDQLSGLNVPVYAVKVASFKEVTHGLRVVGALSGNREAGEREALRLEQKLAAVRAKVPQGTPSVLVLVGAGPGQFIAARSNSYLGDLINEIGGKNVVTASDPENFSYRGFTDYSPERILEKNPDVIITASIGGPPGTLTTLQAVRANPALSTLKAVREGRVYEVDANIYIQSAGPRVSLILDELPRFLYPGVFTSS